MLRSSLKKFPTLRKGTNVSVAIPPLDRCRLSARNIQGVILCKPISGLYRIGTKFGILKRWSPRQVIRPLSFNDLSVKDVPTKLISVRSASAAADGRKMGHQHCSCMKGCKTNKCNCIKRKVKCGSKCHPRIVCSNKH